MKKAYSIDQRAEILASLKANGGNYSKTSREWSVPRATLIRWKEGKGPDGQEVLDLVPQKVIELSDKLENIAHMLTEAIPEKIQEAKLQNIVASLGIVIDKRNLLRGQPTSISENRTVAQQYEGAVNRLIADAKKNGVDVDRSEAIDLLDLYHPGVKKIIH